MARGLHNVRFMRKRRDAAAAREAILDVAEKHLVTTGPAGIRLQEVARDAGVSHPTVLHHFGSREALVKAVCTRAVHAIHIGLVDAIAQSTGEDDQLQALLDGVHESLTRTGHARVIMWLALSGERLEGADVRLDAVVAATHELRKQRLKKAGIKRAPPLDDTAFAVVLAAFALIASGVIGPAIFENAGLSEDSGASFRGFLAKLLARHLNAG